MRPNLEFIEQKLTELLELIPPLYLPEPETEKHVKLSLEWVQKQRDIIDQYQENASPKDEEILMRLDKLFARATHRISDGFDFREDLELVRLDLERLERQTLAAIEMYKLGVASAAEATSIRNSYSVLWQTIQQNAINNRDLYDDDTMERLKEAFNRLLDLIALDIQSR